MRVMLVFARFRLGSQPGLTRLPALAPERDIRSILFGRAGFFERHAFIPE
jgi:hypothetical protein